MTDWAVSLVAAGALSLVATPFFRQVALATGFVDVPDARKAHGSPVPYLGGVAVAGAALVALAIGPDLSWDAVALALVGAGLAIVGLVDDGFTLPMPPRLAAQGGAGLLAVAFGVRFEVSGVAAIDVPLTVLWIVTVTNALNLVDNMDGQSSGLATAGAAAIMAIGVLADAPVVAAFGAVLLAAAAGFLVWNLSPARVFLGDAGSLFLGFMLAVSAVELATLASSWAGRLVTVLVVAVPLLDVGVVTVARLLHGEPIGLGAKDHLSHRLVGRGLGKRPAVAVLVVAQALLSLVAVALHRDAAPWPLLAAAAAAVVAGLLAAAWPVAVYHPPMSPRRGVLVRRWAVPSLAVAVVAAAAAMAAADVSLAAPAALATGAPGGGRSLALVLGALAVAGSAGLVATARRRVAAWRDPAAV